MLDSTWNNSYTVDNSETGEVDTVATQYTPTSLSPNKMILQRTDNSVFPGESHKLSVSLTQGNPNKKDSLPAMNHTYFTFHKGMYMPTLVGGETKIQQIAVKVEYHIPASATESQIAHITREVADTILHQGRMDSVVRKRNAYFLSGT